MRRWCYLDEVGALAAVGQVRAGGGARRVKLAPVGCGQMSSVGQLRP